MIHPVVQSGELPATPLPSLEVQADSAALVATFGTDQVREKAEAWQSLVRQTITAAELVAWEEADPSGSASLREESEGENPRVAA
jgi:hypothetical protein